MKRLALVVALCACGCLLPAQTPQPAPPEPAPIPVPQSEFTALAQPIAAALLLVPAGPTRTSDAAALAVYFETFAAVVERDKTTIRHTGDLRSANDRAGKLMFPELAGRYPGLKVAVDGCLTGALSLETRLLDDSLRKRSVDTLRAMSAVCKTVK